jgi:hypothetical protein
MIDAIGTLPEDHGVDRDQFNPDVDQTKYSGA